ncbi:MAG: hypothetical protein IPL99_12675 [Candidatus Competibacteraceae bacterium]|nr:hypothetical protein [Candidatus Competibacteraceae bacterium]
MKRQWGIRRRTMASTDGQQRWDRAYQWLLEWSRHATDPTVSPPEGDP